MKITRISTLKTEGSSLLTRVQFEDAPSLYAYMTKNFGAVRRMADVDEWTWAAENWGQKVATVAYMPAGKTLQKVLPIVTVIQASIKKLRRLDFHNRINSREEGGIYSDYIVRNNGGYYGSNIAVRLETRATLKYVRHDGSFRYEGERGPSYGHLDPESVKYHAWWHSYVDAIYVNVKGWWCEYNDYPADGGSHSHYALLRRF